MSRKVYFHFDLHNTLKLGVGAIFQTTGYNRWAENVFRRVEQFSLERGESITFDLIESCNYSKQEELRIKAEAAFEKIRLERFNDKPSRLRCIFLTAKLLEWHGHIRRAEDEKNAVPVFYSFACETAKTFIADCSLYEEACKKIANQRYNEAEDMICRYWEGKGDGRKEILCEGELRVVNKSLNMESL